MDLKTRIALTIAAVISLVLASFGFFIYAQVREKLMASAAQTLNEHMEHEWRHLEMHHGAVKAPSGTLQNRDVRYRVIRNGVVLFDTLPTAASGGVPGDHGITQRMEKKRGDDTVQLIGYFDLVGTATYLATLKRILLFGCLFGVLLVIPLSWGVTKVLLSPFRKLSAKTAELGAENLGFRFPEPRQSDEYGILVRSINALLKRLETSFTQMRRFARNASHELRTPLTVIRGEAEVLLRRPREVREYEAALRNIVTQTGTLQHIINRLLFLANLERMESEPQNTAIDVRKTVSKTLDSLRLVHQASDKQVEIKADGRPFFIGHRELFLSVVSNILENAVKYANGRILVHVKKDEEGLHFDVDDDGPGIPDAYKEEVFEPLFNAPIHRDTAKSKESHGLGLSIVKACVGAARGNVWLEDSPLGGLGVRVLFPDAT